MGGGSGHGISALLKEREREGKSERGVERYTNSDRRTRLQLRSGVLEQRLRSRWEEVRPNFASAVAYHFCLNLPAAFMQPYTG